MKTRASSWTIPYATIARAADAREGNGAVEPRLSLVTLGVSDLRRAVAFYRDGLGWPKSELGGDEVAFFKTGGPVLALFPREALAADAGVDIGGGRPVGTLLARAQRARGGGCRLSTRTS